MADSKQTENYIVLKPIAERFSKIANSFSDEEIRSIIKSEMREQIKNAIDFSSVGNLVDDYIEDHSDDISNMVLESIKKKLELVR